MNFDAMHIFNKFNLLFSIKLPTVILFVTKVIRLRYVFRDID